MNSTISCLIADDEPLARKLLRTFIAQQPELDLIQECRNGQEVLDYFAEGNHPELLFLDIQMPFLNGINLVEQLSYSPLIIYSTAYEQYAAKAFEFEVVDYLIKPFSQERFEQAVGRAKDIHLWKHQTAPEFTPSILVNTEYRIKKILLEDILFVEAMKEYVKIYTGEKDYSLVYMRMKDLEKELGDGFIRTHRSFIASIQWIEEIKSDGVRIGQKWLPLSRSQAQAVKMRWMNAS